MNGFENIERTFACKTLEDFTTSKFFHLLFEILEHFDLMQILTSLYFAELTLYVSSIESGWIFEKFSSACRGFHPLGEISGSTDRNFQLNIRGYLSEGKSLVVISN